MKILLDSNIFFSALIKADGVIAEIIFELSATHQLFISDATFEELAEHQHKLIKASKLSLIQFETAKHFLLQRFTIVHSFSIPSELVNSAYLLVKEQDGDDMPFVAANDYLKSTLWTGDKPLYNHLKLKRYKRVMNTSEIRTIII